MIRILIFKIYKLIYVTNFSRTWKNTSSFTNARSTWKKTTGWGSILVDLTDIPSLQISTLKDISSVRVMHARPKKGRLAGAAFLRGASDKPSTWFPFGEHVQKELLSWRLPLFGQLSCRPLCCVILVTCAPIPEFQLNFTVMIIHKFLYLTLQMFVVEKNGCLIISSIH
jgi:hypothetical protein